MQINARAEKKNSTDTHSPTSVRSQGAWSYLLSSPCVDTGLEVGSVRFNRQTWFANASMQTHANETQSLTNGSVQAGRDHTLQNRAGAPKHPISKRRQLMTPQAPGLAAYCTANRFNNGTPLPSLDSEKGLALRGHHTIYPEPSSTGQRGRHLSQLVPPKSQNRGEGGGSFIFGGAVCNAAQDPCP